MARRNREPFSRMANPLKQNPVAWLQYDPNFNINYTRQSFFHRQLSLDTAESRSIIGTMLIRGFREGTPPIVTYEHVWGAVMKGLEAAVISYAHSNRNVVKWIQNWYVSLSLHMQPFTEQLSKIFDTLKRINDRFSRGTTITSSNDRNRNLFKLLLSDDWMCLININNAYILENCYSIQENYLNSEVCMNVLLSCYDAENPIWDDFGRTGLHYAARVGHSIVIEALLEIHLNIDQKDVEGKTALDYIYDNMKDQVQRDYYVDFRPKNNPEFGPIHSSAEFNYCAAILLQHFYKLRFVTPHVKVEHETTDVKLVELLKNDLLHRRYYNLLHMWLKTYKDEIEILKTEKFGELSYFDLITKNNSQIVGYTKRKEVIETLQMSDDILQKFKIYGTILKHRFHLGYLRDGLLNVAENKMFQMFKCHRIPIEIVHKIMNNLNNNELFDMLKRA